MNAGIEAPRLAATTVIHGTDESRSVLARDIREFDKARRALEKARCDPYVFQDEDI
jgi:hypothetical protein